MELEDKGSAKIKTRTSTKPVGKLRWKRVRSLLLYEKVMEITSQRSQQFTNGELSLRRGKMMQKGTPVVAVHPHAREMVGFFVSSLEKTESHRNSNTYSHGHPNRGSLHILKSLSRTNLLLSECLNCCTRSSCRREQNFCWISDAHGVKKLKHGPGLWHSGSSRHL